MAAHSIVVQAKHEGLLVAWAEIILYLTAADANRIREWVNEEPDVAWIVGAARTGCTYAWKAVDQLQKIEPQEYCIWHKTGQVLTIPPGRGDGVPVHGVDREIADPYLGWTQTLARDDETRPWFGSNLPGPYSFTFKEQGWTANALGRSGFNWAGDHYSAIGMPAHPAAKKWWARLKRFIGANSTPLPWPQGSVDTRRRSY